MNQNFEEEMYREQYMPMERPFERDQDIAKHLFGVAKYTGKAVNEDSPRANNNPQELQATRSCARLINRLEYGAKMFKWDFTNLIEFFESDRSITDVTGRGKNGMASYLAKSDINIQQAEQMASQNIGVDYSDQAVQSAREKLESKIPFLKRKEM